MVRVIVQLFSKNVILLIKKIFPTSYVYLYSIAISYFFKTNHVKLNRCNVEYSAG